MLIHGTASGLAGKRRTEQPVRRNSYDVDDRRAKPWRPIGDGSKKGALQWIDALLRTAREFDLEERARGTHGRINQYGYRVLEVLLGRGGGVPIDFRTGTLEPAIATIMTKTGFARQTVVAALARLKKHGFLDWVRRTERTGAAVGDGPQVKQATNAYFFDLAQLPKNVLQRFRDLLAIARRRAAERDPEHTQAPPTQPGRPTNPELAAALDRVGALVESASLPEGQNPSTGV